MATGDLLRSIFSAWPGFVFVAAVLSIAWLYLCGHGGDTTTIKPSRHRKATQDTSLGAVTESEEVMVRSTVPNVTEKRKKPKAKKPKKKKNVISLNFKGDAESTDEEVAEIGPQPVKETEVTIVSAPIVDAQPFDSTGWSSVKKSSQIARDEQQGPTKEDASKQCNDLLDLLNENDDDDEKSPERNPGRILLGMLRADALKTWI